MTEFNLKHASLLFIIVILGLLNFIMRGYSVTTKVIILVNLFLITPVIIILFQKDIEAKDD